VGLWSTSRINTDKMNVYKIIKYDKHIAYINIKALDDNSQTTLSKVKQELNRMGYLIEQLKNNSCY